MSTQALAVVFALLLLLAGALFFGRSSETPTNMNTHVMPDGAMMENTSGTHMMPDGTMMQN